MKKIDQETKNDIQYLLNMYESYIEDIGGKA